MIIDTKNTGNLNLHELALLLLLYDEKVDKSRTVVQVKDTDITEALEGLVEKGYVSSSIYSTDFNYDPPYKHVSWALLEKGKIALADSSVVAKKTISAFKKSEIKNRCDVLAPKLMEIYPCGKKPGTSLQWRGYKGGVSEKLQKLLINGNEFTDDEAVEATKAYIASFNGVYTTMRILPYFLSKCEIVGGETKKSCDFMSYVEDIRNNSLNHPINKDWDVELR